MVEKLMDCNNSKRFTFKECILKLYKGGYVQALCSLSGDSSNFNISTLSDGASFYGEYITVIDTKIYAKTNGSFLIIKLEQGAEKVASIVHASENQLLLNMNSLGCGIGIFAI